MKIKAPKFEIGSVVFPIYHCPNTDSKPCRFCCESGMITGANLETIRCPKCSGTKKIVSILEKEWKVGESFEINAIITQRIIFNKIQYFYSKYPEQEKNMDVTFPRAIHLFGPIYINSFIYEEDLFDSPETALSECMRRNSQKKEE